MPLRYCTAKNLDLVPRRRTDECPNRHCRQATAPAEFRTLFVKGQDETFTFRSCRRDCPPLGPRSQSVDRPRREWRSSFQTALRRMSYYRRQPNQSDRTESPGSCRQAGCKIVAAFEKSAIESISIRIESLPGTQIASANRIRAPWSPTKVINCSRAAMGKIAGGLRAGPMLLHTIPLPSKQRRRASRWARSTSGMSPRATMIPSSPNLSGNHGDRLTPKLHHVLGI